MKKVYIKEGQITKDLLLPRFLFDAVRAHETSLGDNPAFPGEDDYPFDYTVLKERFRDLHQQMSDVGIPILPVNKLITYLSDMVVKCREMEKPIKDSLEKLCENAVNRLFAIPEGAVNINCKLVDKVSYEISVGVTPEGSNGAGFKFKDISDFDMSKLAIAKRRLINSLIMGAAASFTDMKTLYMEDLSKLNPELFDLYDKIMVLNEYLTFVMREEMTDEKPKQGSYVEVHVGFNGKKSTIDAQGIIFPLLLHDTIKGLFELFSVYGLPEDRKKAEYIIKKSDFLLAEPWDMRFGVRLWQLIFDRMELADNTNIIPYIFMEIVKLPVEEFNMVMKEFFMNTEKSDEIMNSFIEKSRYNDGYQKFQNRINARNMDRAVIADSYFTASELDGYDIDGEEGGDVIEENDIEELRAYHGSSANFNRFNHKKYLNTGAESQSFGWGTYITSDAKIGQTYAHLKSNDTVYMFNDWKDEGYSDNEIIWSNSNKFFNDFFEEVKSYFSRYNLTDDEVYEAANILFKSLKGHDFRKKATYDYIESFINTPSQEYNDDVERRYFMLKAIRGVLHDIPAMERNDILYEVDIPDDIGFNYLSWYDNLGSEQLEAIKSKLIELGNRANKTFLKGGIKYKRTGEEIYTYLGELFSMEYGKDVFILNWAKKAASLFLMQCGFDGIKYPAGTIWQKPDGAAENAYNYVIFDANKVKIINKTRV